MLRRIGVPEEHQRIFQSDAAALEEAKRNRGVALAVSFLGHARPRQGLPRRVAGPPLPTKGTWTC